MNEKGNGTVMGEVRESLLDTLRQLKDDDKRMDVNKAKAISNVAQTLINSYTLQVRAINALGGQMPEGFVKELTGEAPEAPLKLPAPKSNSGTPPGEGIHAADPMHQPRRAEPRGR